jgi:hypothetical protein
METRKITDKDSPQFKKEFVHNPESRMDAMLKVVGVDGWFGFDNRGPIIFLEEKYEILEK